MQRLEGTTFLAFESSFELFFDEMGQTKGGKATKYRLGESRIVKPGKAERNFRIFYQIPPGLFVHKEAS